MRLVSIDGYISSDSFSALILHSNIRVVGCCHFIGWLSCNYLSSDFFSDFIRHDSEMRVQYNFIKYSNAVYLLILISSCANLLINLFEYVVNLIFIRKYLIIDFFGSFPSYLASLELLS